MEREVTFAAGDVMLAGLLSLPDRGAHTGIVVCHPHPLYGGEMHNNVVSALIERFQREGHATLRFNFRGVGRSTGSHDQGRAEQDDVKAAVGHLLSAHPCQTIVVAGYSFGAFVGLQAGAADPRVHKLIGVALPVASRDPAFLKSVTKPKLLISGDRDDYCPLPKLESVFAGLSEPKSLALIKGADHFFSGFEEEIATVAARFLGEGPAAG